MSGAVTAVNPVSKSERERLRRNICSFCEVKLRVPAEGRCGGMWQPDDGACGWVKAFRTLGVSEALRQAKLPMDQRSAVA